MSDDTGTDAYYNSDEDDLDGSRLLLLELVVMHDGQSDLPSAANYMQRRMHMGLCNIPVGKGSLVLNPYTLKTEHQFAHEPVIVVEVADLGILYFYVHFTLLSMFGSKLWQTSLLMILHNGLV